MKSNRCSLAAEENQFALGKGFLIDCSTMDTYTYKYYEQS